jgi:hypothetical protein
MMLESWFVFLQKYKKTPNDATPIPAGMMPQKRAYKFP